MQARLRRNRERFQADVPGRPGLGAAGWQLPSRRIYRSAPIAEVGRSRRQAPADDQRDKPQAGGHKASWRSKRCKSGDPWVAKFPDLCPAPSQYSVALGGLRALPASQLGRGRSRLRMGRARISSSGRPLHRPGGRGAQGSGQATSLGKCNASATLFRPDGRCLSNANRTSCSTSIRARGKPPHF
jgi:hypothetical protein